MKNAWLLVMIPFAMFMAGRASVKLYDENYKRPAVNEKEVMDSNVKAVELAPEKSVEMSSLGKVIYLPESLLLPGTVVKNKLYKTNGKVLSVRYEVEISGVKKEVTPVVSYVRYNVLFEEEGVTARFDPKELEEVK